MIKTWESCAIYSLENFALPPDTCPLPRESAKFGKPSAMLHDTTEHVDECEISFHVEIFRKKKSIVNGHTKGSQANIIRNICYFVKYWYFKFYCIYVIFITNYSSFFLPKTFSYSNRRCHRKLFFVNTFSFNLILGKSKDISILYIYLLNDRKFVLF